MTAHARIALGAGLMLGVLGRVSDYSLEPVRAAFVLGGPWVVAAVCLGLVARDRREGARLATLALASGVLVYYAVMTLVEGHVSPRYGLGMAAAWGLLAAAVGAFFGFVGAALRTGPPASRALAAVVVGGVLVGEAVLFLLGGASPAFALVLAGELALGAIVVCAAARMHRSAGLLGAAVAVAGSALVIDLGVRSVLRLSGWSGI